MILLRTAPVTLRRLAGLLLGLVVTLSMLSVVPQAAAAQVKPERDFPRLPRVCATPKEQIPRKFIFCQLTEIDPSRQTVFLWGDSHAFMMVPALLEATRGRDVNVVAFLLGGCPPTLPTGRNGKRRAPRNGCEEAGELVLAKLRQFRKSAPEPQVILGINWDFYLTANEARRQGKPAFNGYVAQTAASFFRGTPRLFDVLGRMGVDADVLAPVGQVPQSRRSCEAGSKPYRCSLPRSRVLNKEGHRASYARRITRRLAGSPRLIEVNDAFCGVRRCQAIVDGTFTFYDDLHISATMARTRMAEYFVESVP
ncbi:hypothetical protein GCM10027020_11260 [Nocardioides salsibiostraticola]